MCTVLYWILIRIAIWNEIRFVLTNVNVANIMLCLLHVNSRIEKYFSIHSHARVSDIIFVLVFSVESFCNNSNNYIFLSYHWNSSFSLYVYCVYSNFCGLSSCILSAKIFYDITKFTFSFIKSYYVSNICTKHDYSMCNWKQWKWFVSFCSISAMFFILFSKRIFRVIVYNVLKCVNN